jgi:hypothetical protein
VVSLWAASAMASFTVRATSPVRAELVEAFKDPSTGSGRTDKTGTTAPLAKRRLAGKGTVSKQVVGVNSVGCPVVLSHEKTCTYILVCYGTHSVD